MFVVQWSDGNSGGFLPEAIRHAIRVERRRFLNGELQCSAGALAATRGLEVLGVPQALHEEGPDPSPVGVAGDYEPSDTPGASYADRVLVRHRSASTGGRRLTTIRG